jgi:branched-chain amino acid transport system permease protein
MSDGLRLFLDLVINGLVVGSVYCLISLSMVLIYKGSKVLNLAQGELLMCGAYIGLAVMTVLKLPFIVALIVTIVAMALIGLFVERIFLRPMIGESIIAVIMITLALSYVFKGLTGVIWGSETYVFPSVLVGVNVTIGGIYFSGLYVLTIGLALALVIVFFFFFKYSIYGIALRATASDQLATLSLGISVKRMFGLSWAISAMLSGVIGMLLGIVSGVNLTIGFYGLLALAPILLGGMDSIGGAILASFIVGVVQNLAQGYLASYVGGSVKDITAFSIIVVVMIFRPYGLFGTEEIERL